MELNHSFTVPATVEATWAHFQDIESVAGCFPGATVTEVDGDTFKGSAKVKLGPIALVYNGSGTFLEKDEAAKRFVVEAKGKDKRGNGTAGATVTATMADAGDGSTKVDVATDLAITGKPAQFGRGVMQDVSDKLLQQFVACLQDQVGAATATPAAVAAPAEPAEAPAAGSGSASDPAAGQAAPAAASAAPGAADGPGPATGSAPQPGTAEPASPPPAAAPPPRAATPPPAAPASAPTSAPRRSDDALDLGATVLPILAKTYWKQALGGVVLLVLLVAIIKKLL